MNDNIQHHQHNPDKREAVAFADVFQVSTMHWKVPQMIWTDDIYMRKENCLAGGKRTSVYKTLKGQAAMKERDVSLTRKYNMQQ